MTVCVTVCLGRSRSLLIIISHSHKTMNKEFPVPMTSTSGHPRPLCTRAHAYMYKHKHMHTHQWRIQGSPPFVYKMIQVLYVSSNHQSTLFIFIPPLLQILDRHCTHTHACTCMYARTHAHMNTCTHTCTHEHMHTHMHTCTHEHYAIIITLLLSVVDWLRSPRNLRGRRGAVFTMFTDVITLVHTISLIVLRSAYNIIRL